MNFKFICAGIAALSGLLLMYGCLNDSSSEDNGLTITLNGNAVDTVRVGVPYVDPGATATDETDGDLTASITVDYDTLNPANPALGTYTLTYSVKNSVGDSVAVERTVDVIYIVREITENIEAVTTWETGYIYLIRAWDFYVMNTLTIQPGVIIKFHPDDGPDLALGGSATILARGTVEKPIIFTSFKDDNHGYDNNGDGSATQPAVKDWGEINTNSTNGSEFEYCEFYYGGSSTYNATLTLYGDNYIIRNCKFAHNDGSYTSGNYARTGVLDATDAGSNTVIQNNIFYDNVTPLSISEKISLDNSNQFHDPNNQSITNTYNSIWIDPEDAINSNVAWEETEVAFVIDEIGMAVETGGRLTLGNDVVIKFMPYASLTLDEGEQNIPNYNGTGVFFTSYKDDTRKGDTNGDGSATTPADGDWIGIYDNRVPTTTPDPYYFQWTNIFYDTY